MTTEYRVELYADNEGREPDRYHLVEYCNGRMAGSAIGVDTADKMFAETMAKVINGLLAERAWQPIVTAPKDGTPILLACSNWPHATILGKPMPIKIGGWDNDAWHIFGASWMPTDWMPLPAPPETVP